jgi:hypothetical protein
VIYSQSEKANSYPIQPSGIRTQAFWEELAALKPDAIACERDLSSELVDSYLIPIIGISNERPYGPCFYTQVDLEKVKEAIRFLSRG